MAGKSTKPGARAKSSADDGGHGITGAVANAIASSPDAAVVVAVFGGTAAIAKSTPIDALVAPTFLALAGLAVYFVLQLIRIGRPASIAENAANDTYAQGSEALRKSAEKRKLKAAARKRGK